MIYRLCIRKKNQSNYLDPIRTTVTPKSSPKKEIKKECKDHGDDEDENWINIGSGIAESYDD